MSKREHSVSPKSFNRIRSANPLNLDRDKLREENLTLKNQLKKIRNDMASNKKEISNLENELSQKDRLIEEMMNEFQPDQNQQSLNYKISESHLVINLKKQYKELKKENERLQKENENVKKNIKTLILI